jgi:hypothetical protein
MTEHKVGLSTFAIEDGVVYPRADDPPGCPRLPR